MNKGQSYHGICVAIAFRETECFEFLRGPKCTGIRGFIHSTDNDFPYGVAQYEKI